MDDNINRIVVALVTSFIPMIFSLGIHEWGHARVAVALGDETPREEGRLTLNPVAHIHPVGTLMLPLALLLAHIPVFGWARPVNVTPRRFTRRIRMTTGIVLTWAAGPIMNLLIALTMALVLAGTSHFGTPLTLENREILGRIELMNAMLFVFNLLPVPPLDGSHVLAVMLPTGVRDWYAQLSRFSGVFIALLLVLGGEVVLAPSVAVSRGLNQVARACFP
jgi:Zn-dependent protease